MVDYIDEEEKELIESLHSEKWVSDFNDDIKKMYEESAQYSILSTKRINIKVTEKDFEKIQAKALQEGLSYQSLISMLIHKYNEGKVAFRR